MHRRKLNRLVFFFSLLIFWACSQENDLGRPTYAHPTIEPLPYLPVYPGSYWIYVDSKGDTIVKSSAKEYRSVSADCQGSEDSIMVPFYDGMYIHGYNYIMCTDYPLAKNKRFHGILRDDSVGTLVQYWSIPRGFNSTQIIERRDFSLIVNGEQYDSVLVVLDYSSGGGLYNNDPYIENSRKYYAKNVGLILEEGGNYVTRKALIAYYINR